MRFFCLKCQLIHDKVDLAPLPPCPVPKEVWASLRKLPKDIGPILTKPVDMETMDRILFGWRNDRSSGRDGQARDFLKEDPYQFAELYRAATNAFLQGEALSVDADEWEGSILSP